MRSPADASVPAGWRQRHTCPGKGGLPEGSCFAEERPGSARTVSTLPSCPEPAEPVTRARPAAVLLDRDGTLVVDVPYNGDPDKVLPLPGVADALARLRRAGVQTALVSNQSGVARGLLSRAQVDAVNARLAELVGPLGPVFVCEHGPSDGCDCRKPRPGLVRRAAAALGVLPTACALVGDIGADVDAALAAGARPVLVPTAATRPEEVAAAPEVAADLGAAVDLLLGVTRAPGSPAGAVPAGAAS